MPFSVIACSDGYEFVLKTGNIQIKFFPFMKLTKFNLDGYLQYWMDLRQVFVVRTSEAVH